MSVFDTVKKIIIGNVAHDTADSGAPVKIGGRYRASWTDAVGNGDRVDFRPDAYGRLYVVPTGSDTGANDTNPPTFKAKQSPLLLQLTPGAPTPTGTDITDHAGNAIEAADLTIVDTAEHPFVIPMAASGYRSLTIGLKNGTVTWAGATITVSVYGAIGANNSATDKVAKLGSFLLRGNSSSTCSICTNAVSDVGGAPMDVAGDAAYEVLSVPNLSDGWPYIFLILQASANPSAGEIVRMDIMRLPL